MSELGCYHAVVRADGRDISLGRYATAAEAAFVLEFYSEALNLGLTLEEFLAEGDE